MPVSILVVGAGGTGSYFIPLLRKHLGPRDEIILMDGDTLETGNLDRQLFHRRMVGTNKAEALALMYPGGPRDVGITPVNEYLTNPGQTATRFPQLSAVVACPDNHPARLMCLSLADSLGIPAVLCGNEVESAEAMLYLPLSRGTKADPRVAYPEMLTADDRDPTRACTGAAQDANLQLALANFISAGLAMSCLYKAVISRVETPELLPFELSWNPYRMSTSASIESLLQETPK